MPYVKIWIHFVWATKNRTPLLTSRIRSELINHIKTYAREKGVFLMAINGSVDHMHALVSMKASQSVSKVAQLRKGESSYWMNCQHLISGKFDWQDEYFAVSVSESSVSKVKKYINNQVAHHRKKSFTEEYSEFIQRFRFEG